MEVSEWLSVGIVGAFLSAMIVLVRLAIGSERRRADDWRTAAQASSEANKVISANVDKLVSAVEQLSASQRETLSLLHTVVDALRGRS